MKVVSLNLKCAQHAQDNTQGEREPRIVAFLRDQQPASVGFQETEPFWRWRLDEALAGYRRVQPQLMTKNYIYYNVSQVKVVNHGVMWLSETPDIPSKGFGSRFFISATWAIFERLDDGKRYAHINTHLDVHSEDIRRQEIAMVLDLADRLSAQGLPVVMTGDFNSKEDSIIYDTVLKRGYADAKYQTENTTRMGTFNGFGKYGPPDYHGPIDYFFINADKFDVQRYTVTVHWQGELMTDHNVLCLETEIR